MESAVKWLFFNVSIEECKCFFPQPILPGDCPELQLRADAGSSLPAVRRHPGARERHGAQDLQSAAQHQAHLLQSCQRGHRSAAGQCPAACTHC